MADLIQRNVGPKRLREMLAGDDPVLAPGAYDALSARLIEEAGFEAVYMTGFGTAASLLGRPDIGLLTFSEMVDQLLPFGEFVDLIGMPEIRELEGRFADEEAASPR